MPLLDTPASLTRKAQVMESWLAGLQPSGQEDATRAFHNYQDKVNMQLEAFGAEPQLVTAGLQATRPHSEAVQAALDSGWTDALIAGGQGGLEAAFKTLRQVWEGVQDDLAEIQQEPAAFDYFVRVKDGMKVLLQGRGWS